MQSRRRSSERGQATVEWLGAAAVVALILVVVETGGIASTVATGVRCEVSRIFGSVSSCGAGGAEPGGTATGVTVTAGGATSGDGVDSPIVHTDLLGPPAGYAMYVARLDLYCASHPHQRMHPLAPGMPWIPCGPYDRIRQQMDGNPHALSRCVANVLRGAGLGAIAGGLTSLDTDSVGASIAEILKIVGEASARGSVGGGVAGAALACVWGVVSG